MPLFYQKLLNEKWYSPTFSLLDPNVLVGHRWLNFGVWLFWRKLDQVVHAVRQADLGQFGFEVKIFPFLHGTKAGGSVAQSIQGDLGVLHQPVEVSQFALELGDVVDRRDVRSFRAGRFQKSVNDLVKNRGGVAQGNMGRALLGVKGFH